MVKLDQLFCCKGNLRELWKSYNWQRDIQSILASKLQYIGLATHLAERYPKRISLRSPYAGVQTLLGPQKHGNQLYSIQKPLKRVWE